MADLRRDRAADVRLITGATGSGKTHYTRRAMKEPKPRGARAVRVVVWDFKDDHYDLDTLTLRELAMGAHQVAIARYLPRRDTTIDQQFATFCRIAWQAQQEDPSVDRRIVVEEAQKVLRPGVRNEPWENIVEIGRAYGFSVFVVSPRPAYIDLGARSAANFVRCGRLGEEDDARVMGRRLGVPYGEIQRLPDRWAYEFDGRETRLVKPAVRAK